MSLQHIPGTVLGHETAFPVVEVLLKERGYMKKYKILITQDGEMQDGEIIDQIECDSFILAHASEKSSISCSGAGDIVTSSGLLLYLLHTLLGKIGEAKKG